MKNGWIIYFNSIKSCIIRLCYCMFAYYCFTKIDFGIKAAALQSLASLHSQGGLSLVGSNGTGAGSSDLNPAGISSLAALANFNSQSKWRIPTNLAEEWNPIMTWNWIDINAMNMQNLAALAAIASNGNSAGIPSLTNSGKSLSVSLQYCSSSCNCCACSIR